MHLASRYHDISAGHRVVGHESKCRFIHGHNYRIHFFCAHNGGGLDTIGRVIDFAVIKEKLCMWLEHHWDHKLLLWQNDPLKDMFEKLQTLEVPLSTIDDVASSLCIVPFNPTAENMAEYLLYTLAPVLLYETGVSLKKVIVEETRKCAVELGV